MSSFHFVHNLSALRDEAQRSALVIVLRSGPFLHVNEAPFAMEFDLSYRRFWRLLILARPESLAFAHAHGTGPRTLELPVTV